MILKRTAICIMRRNIIRNLWVISIVMFIIVTCVDSCILFMRGFFEFTQTFEYVLTGIKIFIGFLMYITSQWFFGRRAQSILKPILGLVLIDIFVGIYFSSIGNVEDNFKWVFVWSIILFTIRYYCRYALFGTHSCLWQKQSAKLLCKSWTDFPIWWCIYANWTRW